MMKSVLWILAAVCLSVHAAHLPTQTADKTLLHQQRDIYELFWHVDQPTVYIPKLIEKSRTFNIADNVNNYEDQEAITEFMSMLQHGMLPRGKIFTFMDPAMRHEANILFRVLYSANSYNTFYNTAVWARFNVNEMMFIYCLSSAVIHRADLANVRLPPLYEVMPHLYFNEDVMLMATRVAMGETMEPSKVVGGVRHFVLPANYTRNWLTTQVIPEHRLTYFTEDVGLNSFYYLASKNYEHSMALPATTVRAQERGEYYFFLHNQLLNRYKMERLSNRLGEIPSINSDRPIVTGYYPKMRFPNGLRFPVRETNAVVPLHMQRKIQLLRDLHTRLSAAIDAGYLINRNGDRINIYTKKGLNLLGNTVQGNADSVNRRLYKSIDLVAREVFGFGELATSKYGTVPSALGFLSTSMRDPVFFSIYRNILSYYHKYKENLPTYTNKTLMFPGVHIQSMRVDKLVTYFDTFKSMLNNGVPIRSQKEAESMLLLARQQRLNHKPFTYHIDVVSDKAVKGMVRIFLGPKYDSNGHELQLEDNYMDFMELDQFSVDLKVGHNNIERNCDESIYVSRDELPSHSFYKKIVDSIEGTDTLTYTGMPYGFPDRLILPRGRAEGMPLKMFVSVTPIDETQVESIPSPIFGTLLTDGQPMGFPLDRPVDWAHLNLTNILVKDVLVYHTEEHELNVPSKRDFE
nr:hexamerin-like [Nomia melanderi]